MKRGLLGSLGGVVAGAATIFLGFSMTTAIVVGLAVACIVWFGILFIDLLLDIFDIWI